MSRVLFPDAVITGELLERLRLPDIPRYELVEGRIEPLTPNNQFHAEAVARIGALLLAKMPGWRVLCGDPGVYTQRQPDTVRGPDVVAISKERNRQVDPQRAFLTVMPELVVEVISPSNDAEEIARKVAEYAEQDALVLVVNLDDGTVTAHSQAGSIVYVPGEILTLPNGATVDAAAFAADWLTER